MQDLEEVYRSVEPMIHQTIREINWGVDYQELLSVANEAFVVACRSFDPEKKVKLSTWIKNCVRYKLLNERKRASREYNHREDANLEMVEFKAPSPFAVTDFIRELSDDARTAVTLVLHAPGEVLEINKMALMKVLRRVGWTAQRVRGAFDEVWRIMRG